MNADKHRSENIEEKKQETGEPTTDKRTIAVVLLTSLFSAFLRVPPC
jgi:hypothetical protein